MIRNNATWQIKVWPNMLEEEIGSLISKDSLMTRKKDNCLGETT